MDPYLIAVMGPTASGKSALAERLADQFDADLLNADAFQVYRGLDIGTAKPEQRARYQLIDILDPRENFGLGEFVARASAALWRAHGGGRSVVVVGGTGLYVRALMEGYTQMRPAPNPSLRKDLETQEATKGQEFLAHWLSAEFPEVAARVDLKNPVRVRRALERELDPLPPIRLPMPNFRKLKLAILPNPQISNARIDSRLDLMVQNGWVDEVRRLLGEGIPREAPGLRAIGYRLLYDCVLGMASLEETIEAIRTETRRYAKRQRTWLRSEPNLSLLSDGETAEQAFSEAMRLLAHR